MKTKKIIVALLSLFTMLTVGVACGEASDDNGQPNTPTEQENITLSLNIEEATINVFETLTLSARVTGTNEAVEWSSSNNSVATVSADGVVTPLKAGVVIITARVGDEEAECFIEITEIQGNIEIATPYETLELEKGQTKNIAVVGYVGTIELDGGEFTYESMDEEIVIVAEDGTVTALKGGETTIKVSATFNGEEAEAIEIPVVVRDIDRIEIADTIQFYANRQSALSIDLSGYNYTSIDAVEIDGQELGFSMSGKMLNVAKSELASIDGGEKNIEVIGTTESGEISITAQVLYVNFAIGTVEELKAFGQSCTSTSVYKYVILTDDIDYNNQKYYLDNVSWGAEFNGCFDGQGHTISNIKVRHGFFGRVLGARVGKPAILKNFALVNIDKDTNNGGGLLANELNYAVVDNIYVEGVVSGYEGTATGAIMNNTANGTTTISNSVFIVNYTKNPNKCAVWCNLVQGILTIDNVFSVCGNSSGKLYASKSDSAQITQTTTNDSAWLSGTVDSFKTKVTEVPEGFDTNYWEMRDGLLTFVNNSADPESIVEEVTITGEQTVGKNRNETLTFNLDAYDMTEIKSLTFGGYQIASSEYTYENNVLTVNSENFPVSGHVSVAITGKTANGLVKANAQAYVVDYAIGTVAELNEFGAYVKGLNVTSDAIVPPYTYAILTANIDYNNGNWHDVYDSGYFNGMFDGQGYTISNIKVKNSFFFGVRGQNSTTNPAIIKNVAFVNIDKSTDNGGGFLANHLLNALVSNVYVSGKVSYKTSGSAGSVYGYGMYVTIENSVFNLDFATNPNTTPVITYTAQTGATYNNVHVISTNSNGALTNNDANATITNTKLYTSIDAFKTAVTAVPTGFDAEYWEMQDGMLVFKSAS